MGDKVSTHYRRYLGKMEGGRKIFAGDGVQKVHKIDYSSVRPDPTSEERVKLLNDYVKWDGEGELCWIIHEEGRVCHKVEGHD